MVKRFIAGAVCPACGEQDTLSVEMLDGVPQERTCVRCGFADAPPKTSGNVPRGRLEKPANQTEATPVQIVRLDDKG